MTQRWFVVCDESSTDPQKADHIWTMSMRHDETGWTTDAGTPGYGLTYDQAEELANAANSVHEIKELIGALTKILRSAGKYAFSDEDNIPGLKRKMRAQIKTCYSLLTRLRPEKTT